MKPDLFVEKSIKEFLSTKQTNWLHQQRYPPRPSKIEKKKKKKKKKKTPYLSLGQISQTTELFLQPLLSRIYISNDIANGCTT